MADTWTMLSGYTASNYVDTMVFEVVSATKKIKPLSGQTLVAGEKNSQYVRFEMDRFWDGIDISPKNFSITYSLAGKYYGTSEAVSAEVSTDRLRFGWIVPEEACCIAGTLMFVLVIKSDGYVLKTKIAETPVVKSLDEESVVPEPTREAWYKEFQARVQEDLNASQAALTSAQDALTRANTANDAATEANLAAQDAVVVAKERYGSPLVANAGPEMVDTNRVYVFTGSESAYTYGHWYYYDNGVWNDGGVYNGNGVNTDKTLSIENMPADAKKTGDEISELKSGLSDADFAIKQEKARAESEESRIEALFTAPTQEAVDKWLDEHPEATTTVLDGSITDVKLSDNLKDYVAKKSDAPIVQSNEDYSHTDLSNPLSATVKGNQYGFGTVKYVNAENAWRKAGGSGDFANGVTWTYADRFLVLNGTCTAEAAKSVFSGQPLFKQLPAGNYKMIALVNFGNSTINRKYQGASATRIGLYVQGAGGAPSYTVANDKYFHEGYNEIDFTIDFKATIARWKQFTFANDVYDNCRIWIGVYPQNAVISETEYADLENGASVNVALPFGNGYSAVDFMQYPSVITSAISVESYFRRMTAYITPEHFYGGIIPSTVDATPYIQQAMEYGRDNGVAVRCNGTYNTVSMLNFEGNNTDIYINRLVYSGETDYAFRLLGRYNKLRITYLKSDNAGGLSVHAKGSTSGTYTQGNQIEIEKVNAELDAIAFTAVDGLVGGLNSYNIVTCKSITSKNGNGINLTSSASAENVFNGGEMYISNGWGLYIKSSDNEFNNFCLESSCYQGIYLTGSSNRFTNCRTIECQDHCDNEGRPFMSIGGLAVNNVFVGRAPSPCGIDFSELQTPREDMGHGVAAGDWLYGSTVCQPVIKTQGIGRIRRSTYYKGTTWYHNFVGDWSFNFEKKMICKLTRPTAVSVTAETMNMNAKTEYNYFVVDTIDAEITLSPSYCADGIAEIYVEQKNGYSATIIDDIGNTIFNGGDGNGLYKIIFVAEEIPYTSGNTHALAMYYGKNSHAVVEKLS